MWSISINSWLAIFDFWHKISIFVIFVRLWWKLACGAFREKLITNMVEFCQNYRLIDQKSIDKLSILSFYVRLRRKLARGSIPWRWSRIWWSFARIIDWLIRKRSIVYGFCHFFVRIWRKLAYEVFDDGDYESSNILTVTREMYENKWRPMRTCSWQWKLVSIVLFKRPDATAETGSRVGPTLRNSRTRPCLAHFHSWLAVYVWRCICLSSSFKVE